METHLINKFLYKPCKFTVQVVLFPRSKSITEVAAAIFFFFFFCLTLFLWCIKWLSIDTHVRSTLQCNNNNNNNLIYFQTKNNIHSVVCISIEINVIYDTCMRSFFMLLLRIYLVYVLLMCVFIETRARFSKVRLFSRIANY